MALDDTEKLFLYNLTTQLLTNDSFVSKLSGGNASAQKLRNMVLEQKRDALYSNPGEEALAGRFGEEAAKLGRAATNIQEVADLLNKAEAGLETIKTALTDMQTWLQGYIDGDYTASETAAALQELETQIESIVKNTSYNGISLFDTSYWASDDRVTVNGDVGEITIQGEGDFTIELVNLRDDLITNVGGTGESLYTPGVNPPNTGDTQNAAHAQDALDDKITPALETITSLEAIIEAQADQFTVMADNLSTQADTLALAAENRKLSNTTTDTGEALLDYLLTLTGSLLDEST